MINGRMTTEELMRSLHQNYNGGQQQHGQYSNMSSYDSSEPSDLDGTNLYIKNLWKDCTQVELDDLFKQFGVISQSRVYGDGVGFVRFEQAHEARRAIHAMHNKKMDRCS